MRVRKNGVPENFEEWMYQNFGRGLSETFLLPYNRKVWAHEPRHMSHTWNRERMPRPDRLSLLKNFALRTNATSWGPNRTFRFPKVGGTGSVWKRMAEYIGSERVSPDTRVVHINTAKKQVLCTNGNVYTYENLLTTVPLTTLVQMITPTLPEEVLQAAQNLKHSSSHIVGIGLKGAPPAHIARTSWLYFPESSTPFYRATVFSNYSTAHTPQGEHWSLMTETSETPHKPVDKETIIEEAAAGALKTGLIKNIEDIASAWHYRAEHGYPTPSLGRDSALAVLFPALEERGIASRGRFGGWKYEVSNQDHSFMQGVEWADRMHSGKPEVTLFYPERVNTRTPRS
jgi:protoporphyrinogen oxidase